MVVSLAESHIGPEFGAFSIVADGNGRSEAWFLPLLKSGSAIYLKYRALTIERVCPLKARGLQSQYQLRLRERVGQYYTPAYQNMYAHLRGRSAIYRFGSVLSVAAPLFDSFTDYLCPSRIFLRPNRVTIGYPTKRSSHFDVHLLQRDIEDRGAAHLTFCGARRRTDTLSCTTRANSPPPNTG